MTELPSAPAARGRAVSGAVSLPSRGAFHLSLAVLVRYRSQGVFSLGGRSPLFTRGFTCPALLRAAPGRGRVLRVRGCYPVPRALPRRFRCTHPLSPAGAPRRGPLARPRPRGGRDCGSHGPSAVWAISGFARRYSRNRCCFLLLGVLRCFSSPAGPLAAYGLSCGWRGMAPAGFPHSDTRGSKGECPSPRTIAACRVLRRPPAPRHPPRALKYPLVPAPRGRRAVQSGLLRPMSSAPPGSPPGGARYLKWMVRCLSVRSERTPAGGSRLPRARRCFVYRYTKMSLLRVSSA